MAEVEREVGKLWVFGFGLTIVGDDLEVDQEPQHSPEGGEYLGETNWWSCGVDNSTCTPMRGTTQLGHPKNSVKELLSSEDICQ